MINKIVVLIVASLVLATNSFAQRKTLSENSSIFLITCSPGEELYSRFGHTALRVIDQEKNIDYIFNYGVFSFETENFYYKFVKGETDYMLVGSSNIERFLSSYSREGRGVVSNKLNLTQEENQELFDQLLIGCRKENRLYRYNFLFNNCATKVRDIVASAISEEIIWDRIGQSDYTYRELIDLYVPIQSWASFGIYLALGQTCDAQASEAETMFLPDFLQTKFEKSIIHSNSSDRQIALESLELLPVTIPIHDGKITSLWLTLFALLFAAIFFAFWEQAKGRTFVAFDYLFFFSAGIAGCILFFIDFISVHPVSEDNFNLLYLHPLYLLLPVLMPFKKLKVPVQLFHKINAVAIILFMLATIIPGLIYQSFHPGIYIIITIILIRNFQNYKLFRH